MEMSPANTEREANKKILNELSEPMWKMEQLHMHGEKVYSSIIFQMDVCNIPCEMRKTMLKNVAIILNPI